MTTTDTSRLTLELDLQLQTRLKLVASRRDMPVERYCEDVLKRELANDERGRETIKGGASRIESLIAQRSDQFGDRVFAGNSVDLIEEARAIRDRQMDEW